MRYAIISDIHGNIEALEAVVSACHEYGVRKIFCLGDIIGYGANPVECLKMVQGFKTPVIAGNHDWAVTGKVDTQDFNPVAKKAVEWTQKVLSKDDLQYLNTLELVHKNENFILVHGSLDKPHKFRYLTDLNQSLDTFYLMDRDICFIGHTHVAQVFIQDQGHVRYGGELTVELKDKTRFVVNVGSVGQPRDGDPRSSFCVYDPDLARFEIVRIPYDVATAQKKIIQAGLPEFLAYRLAVGQ